MTPRLAPVLSRRDLPEAELYAARLDGEVFAIDECFCPVDEIEQRTHRARALAAILPARLIAEQRTAAWVLGVLDRPPARHQLCADAGARARPPSTARMTVREVVIDDSELLSYAGMRVTTPLRTALDLARFSTDFGPDEHSLIERLAALGSFGLAECRTALEKRRNLPGKRLALHRFRSALVTSRPADASARRVSAIDEVVAAGDKTDSV